MDSTAPHLKLTHRGALRLLEAAVDHAERMGVPQCIAITDDGGNLLAFIRMSGAKFLSIETAQRKAITAASNRSSTGGHDHAHGIELGLVTGGRLTNLVGGVPIVVDSTVIGAIGVSSGTGEQDLEVAEAALGVLAGDGVNE